MRRHSALLSIVLAMWSVTSKAQLCTDLIGNGSIGVYANAAGTQQCIAAPPGPPTVTHVIAKLAGGSAGGITGAEYRIEIAQLDGSAPTGYLFLWTPAPGNSVALGNPIDEAPQDPANPSGANIAWATCQTGSPFGQVPLGTLGILNFGAGTPFTMRTKQKSPLSNPAGDCPILVLCDAPVFTQLCLTPRTEELGHEGVASVSNVNVPCPGICPPSPPTSPLGIYADSVGTSGPFCLEDFEQETLHLAPMRQKFYAA